LSFHFLFRTVKEINYNFNCCLYGFETVIHGFRLLRRIFGPKRDKETGDWRKLYNEDLHNVIYTTDELTIGYSD
jgi:hypothetical protein